MSVTLAVGHPAVTFLVRRYVELLTALTILFVLQAGLVPFDFVGPGVDTGFSGSFGATASHPTLPDIVSNIFLYVPVGILLHWTLYRHVRSPALVLPATIVLAAALSGGVEWIQAYSPARVSSIIDFVSNVMGATIGSSISWIARRTVPGMLGAALCELHKRPHAALLKTYCFVLVIFAAIPFSFSFDATRMKQAVKSANFVPFAESELQNAWTADSFASGDDVAASRVKLQRMKRWSRWLAECTSFVVLAWLLQSVVRSDYGFSCRATTALVWWLGGALAIGLSALQLPIVSRGCDVTDVLFRLLGLWLGLITRSVDLRNGERLTAAVHARQRQRLARIGCAAAVGYIAYTGVIPLTFAAEAGGPTASLASEGFLPFFAYFVARFDLMMADAMEKFVSYAVFSALLAICWTPVITLQTQPRLLAITTIGVAISTVIEIVQMFIAVRVTSLTDPILAAAGCLTGVLMQQHILGFYHFATSHAFPGPEVAERLSAPASRLPPSDALVATLTEPRADAPAEPSPMPRSRTRR